MFIYTIFNLIILNIIGFLLFVVSFLNSIVNIPNYIIKIKNHYNLVSELNERTDVLMKEIVSLHKMQMAVDETLTEIVSTMRFTGAEWQSKIIQRKLDKVLRHHYPNYDKDHVNEELEVEEDIEEEN